MQEIDTEANSTVCVCVAVIASIVESWNMFQSQNIHVVTCHTAGTLETVGEEQGGAYMLDLAKFW